MAINPSRGPPEEPTPQSIPASTCADCHENLDDSLLAETKCGHFFHIPCLLNFLQETDKCPSCREKISDAKGWDVRHIPCDKTIDKSELVWNDVHHLWMHKGCRFSVIDLRHLTHPKLMQSADNSPGSSKRHVHHLDYEIPKFNNPSNVNSRGTNEKNILEAVIPGLDRSDRMSLLLESLNSVIIKEAPVNGTSERMTLKLLKPVIPEPNSFDKISLNTFDSDVFNEPLTIEHRPVFESTDEINLPNEKSEISENTDEDICKFCKEKFDHSHKPTTVTVCGHPLHTHCNLPTKKQCPVREHAVNWVDVNDKCVFCLEPFNWNGDMRVKLPCAHESHHNCYKLWMCTINYCPICKGIIYSRDGCSVCSKPDHGRLSANQSAETSATTNVQLT